MDSSDEGVGVDRVCEKVSDDSALVRCKYKKRILYFSILLKGNHAEEIMAR